MIRSKFVEYLHFVAPNALEVLYHLSLVFYIKGLLRVMGFPILAERLQVKVLLNLPSWCIILVVPKLFPLICIFKFRRILVLTVFESSHFFKFMLIVV